jgi:replicative DNA helicase
MSAVSKEELDSAAPWDELGESAPIPEERETFKFDDAFQSKIAALALRDTTFMQQIDGLLLPEYFSNQAEACLANIAIRYFKKYKKVPADTALYGTLIRQDITAKIIKVEMARGVVARLQELWKVDISDRDFIAEQVATFARYQAVSSEILRSVEKLEMHDFDNISKALTKALSVGVNRDGGRYSYAEMIEARTDERVDRAAGKAAPTGISTGYPAIDKFLYHKGWGRRELSVLMGGAKAGKTTALIDFGIAAASHMHRFNVLYITLEVSAKIIAERMDANISDQVIMELGDHIHDVKEKVSKWHERAGKFEIQEFPAGSMTVSDLRRVIEKDKMQGTVYDLVIVDYADLMAPERFTESVTENSKSVYTALRGLAMQEGFAVLTATQTNREGAKAAVAKVTDIAEDFNKVRIADVIISINKTDEERSLGQARLYFAACRNQASGFSIRIEQQLDKMKFITKVLGTE